MADTEEQVVKVKRSKTHPLIEIAESRSTVAETREYLAKVKDKLGDTYYDWLDDGAELCNEDWFFGYVSEHVDELPPGKFYVTLSWGSPGKLTIVCHKKEKTRFDTN